MLIDPQKTKDNVVRWIRDYFDSNGKECTAVIGISGGKDSTVVAGLCTEALGKDRVLGILMPNNYQSDIKDSIEICKHLDITYMVVNIGGMYDEVVAEIGPVFDGELTEQTLINIAPRLRMTVLYGIAQSVHGGGRVANTCNLAEEIVGYSTKWGDNTGDFSPLGELFVSEVKQIGHALHLPYHLVEKTPSDGLCGKSDEENLGFTYDDVELWATSSSCSLFYEKLETMQAIRKRYEANKHKKNNIATYMIDTDERKTE